ncbi:MAG TPA: patatin-like phospholipase family protein [Gammaproteobacteria bacterium]|nr:patatin-like phospholipase family protein [Gammaproteobacteria bacterium]
MSNEPFEIGLVGAGAISAGAYTSGVIDFMVYALDEWYRLKKENSPVPPHDVKLSTFSGASAGGITAVLGAAYLGSDQPSIKDEESAAKNKGLNKLFDSWVERIDFESLLDTRDLNNKKNPVLSLLDSTVLSEIADAGLDITPRSGRRPYVADSFELLLTVTNLRGVPYSFRVESDKPAAFDMALHADYVHFSISDAGNGNHPDRYAMSWSEFGAQSSSVKERMKLSAMATGAFPIGLAPRTLRHTIADESRRDCYSSREWLIPTPESKPHACFTPGPVPPNWGELERPYQYEFQCVDGGVMNNEPLELARRMIAGTAKRNTQSGEEAKKAVLLIDPFPSTTFFDGKYKPASGLFGLVLKLFAALKNQARFKADELILAAKDNVYSRFMIAPSRNGSLHPIACGALEGFGGFLKRDFRSHDYFLGRRNAQKFLKDHFILPENNTLFAEWNDAMKTEHYVMDDKGDRFLPIIPLVGGAVNECPLPTWPSYTQTDLDTFLERVESRAGVVIGRLVDQYLKNHKFIRFFVKRPLMHTKKDITKIVESKVKDNLKEMKIMR